MKKPRKLIDFEEGAELEPPPDWIDWIAASEPPRRVWRYCGACNDAVQCLAPGGGGLPRVDVLRCPACGSGAFLVQAGPSAGVAAELARQRAQAER